MRKTGTELASAAGRERPAHIDARASLPRDRFSYPRISSAPAADEGNLGQFFQPRLELREETSVDEESLLLTPTTSWAASETSKAKDVPSRGQLLCQQCRDRSHSEHDMQKRQACRRSQDGALPSPPALPPASQRQLAETWGHESRSIVSRHDGDADEGAYENEQEHSSSRGFVEANYQGRGGGEDGKNAIVKRLNALLHILSEADTGQPSLDMNALHIQVDEMERFLTHGTTGPSVGSIKSVIRLSTEKRSEAFASQITLETEKLHTQLKAALVGLRQRREESDHLHSLLIERVEGAAARILELEEVEHELKGLRLGLTAVEVQCEELMRAAGGVDQELVRSIAEWRVDWARLRAKDQNRSEASPRGLERKRTREKVVLGSHGGDIG